MTAAAVSALAEACGHRLRSLSLDFCTAVTGAELLPVALRCVSLQRVSLCGLPELSDEQAPPPHPSVAHAFGQLLTLHLVWPPEVVAHAQVAELALGLGCGLRELRLSDCTQLGDATLRALGAACPGLSVLEVDRVEGFSDAGLQALAEGCTQLTAFSAARCHGLSGGAPLEAIASTCGASLRRLGCAAHPGAGDALVLALAAKCATNLEELDFSFCRGVSDNALGRLVDACPRLRRLQLYGCRQVTDRFLCGHGNDGLVVLGRE